MVTSNTHDNLAPITSDKVDHPHSIIIVLMVLNVLMW
jgi:hypothetical protein